MGENLKSKERNLASRICIVEDQEELGTLYCVTLQGLGHTCDLYTSVAEARAGLSDTAYDLLILDWMLPDGTSEQIIRWYRNTQGWGTPILVSTVRSGESEIIAALRIGADDYLVKPPRMPEMLARCEAMLRRGKLAKQESPEYRPVQWGPYQVDRENRRFSLDGNVAVLTDREFDLACYLFDHQDKLVSRVRLLNDVWGVQADLDTRTIDAHISRVRHKLELSGQHGWLVSSVYGYGYRLHRTRE